MKSLYSDTLPTDETHLIDGINKDIFFKKIFVKNESKFYYM